MTDKPPQLTQTINQTFSFLTNNIYTILAIGNGNSFWVEAVSCYIVRGIHIWDVTAIRRTYEDNYDDNWNAGDGWQIPRAPFLLVAFWLLPYWESYRGLLVLQQRRQRLVHWTTLPRGGKNMMKPQLIDQIVNIFRYDLASVIGLGQNFVKGKCN